MMWNTKAKKDAQPLVAEEDIKTIAFLIEDPVKKRLCPNYQGLSYYINEASTKVDVVCYKYCDTFFIDEGYCSYEYGDVTFKNHTYVIHNGDNKYGWFFDVAYENTPVKPYECVIPKGTKYYVNDCHKIVSETIIVRKPLMFLTEANENKQL